MYRVFEPVITTAEGITNGLIRDVNAILGAIIGPLGFEGIPYVCFDDNLPPALQGRCKYGNFDREQLKEYMGCAVNETKNVRDMCFFKRQASFVNS